LAAFLDARPKVVLMDIDMDMDMGLDMEDTRGHRGNMGNMGNSLGNMGNSLDYSLGHRGNSLSNSRGYSLGYKLTQHEVPELPLADLPVAEHL